MPAISHLVTSLLALAGIAPITGQTGPAPRLQPVERWVVCYGGRPSPFDLAGYDLIVLDMDEHPPLGPMTERGRTVLAYLSLTQLGRHRSVFAELERAGVVLAGHEVWTDNHHLDFRRPEWTRTVLEQLVPGALAAGFTGLFLDTLDDAELLEERDPVRYRGMRDAAVGLVRAIRHHYPDIVLMVNRGYAIMPGIADAVDIVLGESVLTSFDTPTAEPEYRHLSASDVEWQVDRLRQAQSLNPSLQVFTLDYWDPADAGTIRQIYRDQRTLGFVPYVATPLLDRLVEEPR